MATITQPLRDKHHEMLPRIESLRTAADVAGQAPPDVLRRDVDDVYDFLMRDLIPQAEAEERALYPVIGRMIGTPAVTSTMSRDHMEIRQLTEELGRLRSQLRASGDGVQVRELRRVLYGLYTLVKVHMAKEDEMCLPILEARLSADDVHRLCESLEAAAGEARAHVYAGAV